VNTMGGALLNNKFVAISTGIK